MNKGYLYAMATAFISGFSIWLNQFAVKGFDPIVFTVLKNTLVAVAFLFLVKGSKVALNKSKSVKLALVGLLGGALAFMLFFTGLKTADAGIASFTHKTMFVYITALALIFLKEKITKKHLFGMAFLLLGLFFISDVSLLFSEGVLFIFLATLLWSVENVISKDLINNGVSPNTVTLARMGLGSLFIWSFVLFSGKAISLNFDQFVWVLVTSALLFGYVFTWYRSLQFIPVSEAAALLSLGSVFTFLLAAPAGVLLVDLIGALAILAGFVIYFVPQKSLQLVKNPV